MSHNKHESALVLAEVDQLGIEFRVVPIGSLDGTLGVIKDDPLRLAAEHPKRVLK
jgi:hypothetical protein